MQRVNDSLQQDVRKLQSKMRRAEDAAEDAMTKLQAAQRTQQAQPQPQLQPQPQPQHEEPLGARAATPEQQSPVLVTAGVQQEGTWQAERRSSAPPGEQAGLGTAQKGTLDKLAAQGGQAAQMLGSSAEVRDAQLGQAPGQQSVRSSAQEYRWSSDRQSSHGTALHAGHAIAATSLQQGNAEQAANLLQKQRDQPPSLSSANMASVEPPLAATRMVVAGALPDVADAGMALDQATIRGEMATLRCSLLLDCAIYMHILVFIQTFPAQMDCLLGLF